MKTPSSGLCPGPNIGEYIELRRSQANHRLGQLQYSCQRDFHNTQKIAPLGPSRYGHLNTVNIHENGTLVSKYSSRWVVWLTKILKAGNDQRHLAMTLKRQ